MKKVCKKCGKLKEHKAHGLCAYCYSKIEYTIIPMAGCGVKVCKKGTRLVYTNGFTEELKPLIKKIQNDVFEDCIKNPSKYLQEIKRRCN